MVKITGQFELYFLQEGKD